MAAPFPPFPPNTRNDRTNLLSIRARLGVEAQLAEGVTVGARLASGDTRSPVSTTDLLGGGWQKKDIWLDQAWITIAPVSWAGLTVGRMPNPFLHTDLVYDDDLNFDGAAIKLDAPLDRSFHVFSNMGVFPLEYVGDNTPSTGTTKAPSHTKWLYGAQLGAEWWFARHSSWRVAAAYYDFDRVQGELSQPCDLVLGNDFCSTDPTRPAFMQKGNTLFFLRNIRTIPDPTNPIAPQFVGLMFDYNLLDINMAFDAKIEGTYHLLLEGDYVRNLAFDRHDDPAFGALGHNINNCGPAPDSAPFSCPLRAGNTGWMAKATFGQLVPTEAWDWNVFGGYKYLESDAVLDAYTDSDFHLGGTNAKGYFLGGSLALYHNTWLTARWLSADEISGSEPLAIDVLQIDLNARF